MKIKLLIIKKRDTNHKYPQQLINRQQAKQEKRGISQFF